MLAFAPPDTRLRTATENMEALSGVTAQSLADQMATLEPAVGFLAAAPALAKKPLLVLTSDDGLADGADLLVANVRKAGRDPGDHRARPPPTTAGTAPASAWRPRS